MNQNLKETGAASKTAPVICNGISADDAFILASVIGKIGIGEVIGTSDTDMLKALDYKPPMKMNDAGDMVPLPEEEWTESQQRQALNAITKQSEFYDQLFRTIMTHFRDCRDDIFELLANATGESVRTISALDGRTFVNLLYAYISREEFIDFFADALKRLSGGLSKAFMSVSQTGKN